ncbi:MAG: nucleotidyltransferase family protein, partial [Anaerolineae bacterium]|nr:nucleotidyltransferase family protein [Anaerolineae bacterium]
RDEILWLARKHGASNVRVFGSVARGEASEASDIDFLVDFPADYSLWDRIGLKQDLEDLLGRPVDVVLAERLREILRDDILRESIPL